MTASNPESPFHDGERLVQQRAGEREQAARNGRILADRIPHGAIPFLAQRPMLVAASAKSDGTLTASVFYGTPGFVSAPRDDRVILDRAQLLGAAEDPLWDNLASDPRIGLLSIDLGTRRRLRINGHVLDSSAERLEIVVDEAYPNCPKYIQRRQLVIDPVDRPHTTTGASVASGQTLDPMVRERLRAADTFFVATQAPGGGLDASHRGGRPGFIQILDERRLRIPDYAGNSMFNTLGNLASHPHASLVIPGFAEGAALRLTGRTELRFDVVDSEDRTGGTGRAWDLLVDGWSLHTAPANLAWEYLDAWPQNPG